jgi:3-deoxy-D-manno-octulosonic-acid transferase
MESFVGNRKCIIAGSTWPEDEAVLLEAIAQTPSDWCWLIAPHEMHEDKLTKAYDNCPKVVCGIPNLRHQHYSNCPVLGTRYRRVCLPAVMLMAHLLM